MAYVPTILAPGDAVDAAYLNGFTTGVKAAVDAVKNADIAEGAAIGVSKIDDNEGLSHGCFMSTMYYSDVANDAVQACFRSPDAGRVAPGTGRVSANALDVTVSVGGAVVETVSLTGAMATGAVVTPCEEDDWIEIETSNPNTIVDFHGRWLAFVLPLALLHAER